MTEAHACLQLTQSCNVSWNEWGLSRDLLIICPMSQPLHDHYFNPNKKICSRMVAVVYSCPECSNGHVPIHPGKPKHELHCTAALWKSHSHAVKTRCQYLCCSLHCRLQQQKCHLIRKFSWPRRLWPLMLPTENGMSVTCTMGNISYKIWIFCDLPF